MVAARVRVLEGGQVAASGRAFSLADPDAWMVEKGEPAIRPGPAYRALRG